MPQAATLSLGGLINTKFWRLK